MTGLAGLLSPPPSRPASFCLFRAMAKYEMVFSVLRLGESKLEVVAQGPTRRRKVEITWSRKDPDDVPPENWADQVKKELSYQDSVAHLPPELR